MKHTLLFASLLALTLAVIGYERADATESAAPTTLTPRTEISAAGPETVSINGSGVKANNSGVSRAPQIIDVRDRRPALETLEMRPPVPTAFETAVLRQINAVRADRGLRRLRFSTQLRSAAASHTIEMARVGYFEHRSANGGLWWQRIKRFYPSGTRAKWAVGENLLWSSVQLSPSEITSAWLGSVSHRAILLDPAWREVGAANRRSRAQGIYSGYGQVMILTVDFGSRH